MADITALEQELNQLILQGQVLDGFEKFTTDDVVMIEPNQEPVRGKDANRVREQEFFAMVEEFHGMSLDGWAVNGNLSFSEWSVDITFKDGNRVSWTQVERRTWNDDGKIEEVRFFYPPAG